MKLGISATTSSAETTAGMPTVVPFSPALEPWKKTAFSITTALEARSTGWRTGVVVARWTTRAWVRRSRESPRLIPKKASFLMRASLSRLAAGREDERGAPLEEPLFEADRELVRVHEPLHARVQQRELRLHPRARLQERGAPADELAGAEHRLQEIFAPGAPVDRLAAGEVQRVDDGDRIRQPAPLVVDGIGDDLAALDEAAD